MSEMPRNAREFTLQLSKVLHEMHPELEDIGKVSPKGRPELKTRDAAQINAWYDGGEQLVIHGIKLKPRRR